MNAEVVACDELLMTNKSEPAQQPSPRERSVAAKRHASERVGGAAGAERPGAIYDAIVIGAGPAGLAMSRELSARRVRHVVLERGREIGHTWANLYDSLVLHTTRALSSLPGLPFPAGTPQFPTRLDLLTYLRSYAGAFSVPVTFGMDVVELRRDPGAWTARTRGGAMLSAHSVVVATGIASNPFVPDLPGRDSFRGRIVHSAEFRRPAPFAGQRVLVVGAGNSAADVSVALAAAGIDVTLAIRSGATVLPLTFAGIPIQYLGFALAPLPRALQSAIGGALGKAAGAFGRRNRIPPAPIQACTRVPIIGGELLAAIDAGRIRLAGGIDRLTVDGVRFDDGSPERFDAIILATGYRAAIGFLDASVRRDTCGFAVRSDPVTSADYAGLYFVGHNPDIRGGLYRIARDASRAGRHIKSALDGTRQRSTERRRRHNEK